MDEESLLPQLVFRCAGGDEAAAGELLVLHPARAATQVAQVALSAPQAVVDGKCFGRPFEVPGDLPQGQVVDVAETLLFFG